MNVFETIKGNLEKITVKITFQMENKKKNPKQKNKIDLDNNMKLQLINEYYYKESVFGEYKKEKVLEKEKTNNPPAPTAPILAPATNSQSSNPVAADIVLTPEEAKQHVGEIATVRGKVFGVSVSQKGDVFISIGAKRPAPFTAVCFKQAIPTDQLKALDGQTISVRGKIKDYNGQVETILEREEQILK